MSGLRTLLCFVFVLGLSGLVQAQEDRIRSDFGGIYQSPAWGQGSVTGALTDTITIRTSSGVIAHQMTVDQWRSSLWIPEAYPIVQVTRHSGGQYTIRFNYARLTLYNPAIQGGTVEVRGVANDTDRLY